MPAPALSFPKSARLYRSGEFARLRREGKSVHGKFMVLSFLKAGDGSHARVGFITSRRVGHAVERNRVRRRLREIVRLDRPRLAPGHWLVLVARQASVRAEFSEVQGEWRGLAERAGVFITAA